jgi:hypothetical protein
MNREPVAIGHAVTAVMYALVALGWVVWDDTVITSVAAVVTVLVQLGLSMWARRSVTPLIEPLDVDGTPLLRSA